MKSRLQTTLLFLKQGGSVLLAMKKRGHGEKKWNGVGGKIEAGETPEQAALRECEEEIHVKPTSAHFRGILHFSQKPYVDKYSNSDCHVFVCEQWTGQPSETEEMAPRWFDIDEVPYEAMWKDDIYWLPAVLAGKKVEAHFQFNEQSTLTHHTVKIID